MNKKLLVNKNFHASIIALFVLAFSVCAPLVQAQTRRRPVKPSTVITTTTAANDPLTMLPTSDAVLTVDVQRVLNDALPRAFADDAERLAKINSEIDAFKTRTGIDPRAFDRIAVGMRFDSTPAGKTTTRTIVIAHGTFNAATLIAAGRLASKGQYEEQKYGDKTIYVFTIQDRIKMFGVFDMRINQLAVAALNANMLAIGNPATVRAAIDASRGRGRVGADLTALATRTPNALVGFGANVPASVIKNLDIDNDSITENLNAIRQTYGAISMTAAGGFQLLTVARTEKPEQAQGLNETLSSLKQLGGLYIGQLKGDKKQ